MERIIEIQIDKNKSMNSVSHTQRGESDFVKQSLTCTENVIHTLGRDVDNCIDDLDRICNDQRYF